MIMMRCPGVTDRLILNQLVCSIHIVHPAVKIIRRTAMQNRTLSQWGITLKAECLSKDVEITTNMLLLTCFSVRKLMILPAPTLPSDGWNSNFDSTIRASNIHGEISAHREAMNSQPLRMNFRLLFQKC